MIRRLLHSGRNTGLALVGATALGWAGTTPVGTPTGGNDYPTYARVVYVQECMLSNGSEIANLYKCSCIIDRIATALSYDDFVESGTFARYASLAGEKGGIFRDFEQARDEAKRYRALETDAYQVCGLQPR